jgi:copper transport protein
VPVAFAADLLHLMAMGLWLGGLVALAVLCTNEAAPPAAPPAAPAEAAEAAVPSLPELPGTLPPPSVFTAAARRFSPLAAWCVGVLALTGTLQSLRQLGSAGGAGGSGTATAVLSPGPDGSVTVAVTLTTPDGAPAQPAELTASMSLPALNLGAPASGPGTLRARPLDRDDGPDPEGRLATGPHRPHVRRRRDHDALPARSRMTLPGPRTPVCSCPARIGPGRD